MPDGAGEIALPTEAIHWFARSDTYRYGMRVASGGKYDPSGELLQQHLMSGALVSLAVLMPGDVAGLKAAL